MNEPILGRIQEIRVRVWGIEERSARKRRRRERKAKKNGRIRSPNLLYNL